MASSTTESVKFTWTIDNFSKLDNTEIYSEIFVVGGYKWWMSTFPKADNGEHLSLYLEVADTAALPKGWSKEAHFSLAVVDQIHNKYSIRKDAQHKFNASSYYRSFAFMTLSDLSDPSRGCLVNDTVVLEAEVAVRKVLGYWSYDSKKETGYVGLKKQGATFYINSLLQTLYHIPYFRKAVYHMPITENDMPIGNIPLALQSLFYELQYNDTSVATKDFTKSFGWDIYNSFIPHDMQELNRVLCEKLEDKMKGTVVEGTIRQLFEGHHMTYIEFINVDCKSMRKESFYGLQLDVKGCRDVYDSFDKYVEVERLEGDKKYLAEEHGLQDAKKGILFINFPPVLQLQLKRFEYDFTQDTVVKINDRFEFPLQLDLDRYNGMYLSPEADRSVRNLYTLHSVLVHSGGVLGGHYYAFIRPTLSDQWFKFNDERVTKEDMKRALEEQYGGEEELPQNNPGCNDTPFQFSTYSNAYMLVYIRETAKDKIICNVDEDIAEHLRIRLKKERDEKEDRRRYKVQAHLYTIIKVARDEDLTQQIGRDIYFDLVDHDKVRSFRIQKQSPFSLFKEEVAKEFGIPVQFQRFWIWEKRQNHTYRPNRPLTAQEEAQSVGQLREMSNKTHNAELKLFLEVEFGPDLHPIPPPEKSKEDIVLFFKLYDPEKEELRYVGRLSVKSSSQPIEILAKLNQMAGFAPDEEIELYEEIKFQPFVMCAHLDNGFTFQASQIEDGDIICFQKAPPLDSEEESRYPDVPSFLKYVYNRQIVHFRSLEKPKEDDFCLELSKLHSYDEVVERVALQLGLDDPSKIRLTSHSCYSQQPKPQPINFRGVKHLSDMLVHYYQMSDILYYEVLDITLPELQGLKQATACMRQYQKNNDVPTIVDEEDDTTIPPSPTLSASAPMANSAVSSTQGLTGSTTQLALTPQSIDKFISLSQPTDEPITARTICLPEKKDIGTISLNDVDAFFQSLPSDTPASSVPSVPVVSASPISTSQVSEPSKEEIEEALKQIKEALQMPPVRFNCPGRIFPIEKALQTLSNLDESSGITIGQKADILSLTDKFETLPACVNKAIKARDNLAQMQTLKTTLDQNLKSSIAHFTVKKAETVETEQEIEDLKSKLKAAEKKKETLATEIKELYEGSLLDKKVVDMLNKEMPKYKEEAKAGEEKEKGVNQEWKNMMDLISNISANLKFD